jgi:hypothetical protein
MMPVAFLKDTLSTELPLIVEAFRGAINDAYTRAMVQQRCREYCEMLLGEYVINNYSVVCDEANNAPRFIDQGGLRVDIMIQPRRSVEFLQIPIVMTR